MKFGRQVDGALLNMEQLEKLAKWLVVGGNRYIIFMSHTSIETLLQFAAELHAT